MGMPGTMVTTAREMLKLLPITMAIGREMLIPLPALATTATHTGMAAIIREMLKLLPVDGVATIREMLKLLSALSTTAAGGAAIIREMLKLLLATMVGVATTDLPAPRGMHPAKIILIKLFHALNAPSRLATGTCLLHNDLGMDPTTIATIEPPPLLPWQDIDSLRQLI